MHTSYRRVWEGVHFIIFGGRRGHYQVIPDNVYLRGSDYGPMQCDGFSYLCPQCGGYASVPGDGPGTEPRRCPCCRNGTIALDDPRITTHPQHGCPTRGEFVRGTMNRSLTAHTGHQ